MAKVLRCRDVGIDCDFEARGSEQEVLQQAAEHARRDHGLAQIPDDVMAIVRSVMRDEP